MASCGDTLEDSRASLKEAVELYVETLIEDGQVDVLLEKIGLTKDEVREKNVLIPEAVSGSFEVSLAV